MQEIEKVRKESVSSLTNIPVVKISPANIYTSLQSTGGAGGHGGFFLGTPHLPLRDLDFSKRRTTCGKGRTSVVGRGDMEKEREGITKRVERGTTCMKGSRTTWKKESTKEGKGRKGGGDYIMKIENVTRSDNL